MKTTKWVTTAVALTLVGSVAIGCTKNESAPGATGTPGSTAASSGAQELKLSVVADPPVLDSSKGTAEAGFTILNAFHEGLYRIDKDGKGVPGLAKDLPKKSADGLTYTIDIREDANWSDGQPVKAQDFVYSFKRTLDPTTAAQYSFMVAWIKGGAEVSKAKGDAEVKAALDKIGVKAVSDKQLEITLAKPVTFFTELLAFPVFFPQREDFVKAQGDKYGAEAANVIGAGPFKITEWKHDQSVVLEKNDKYWDAANVKVTKATINVVKDTNAGLNLYDSKAVDFARISGEQTKLFEGKSDLKIKKELTSTYLNFQQQKVPALANKKIRLALGMAIDRQAFIDTVLNDGSTASTGLVPVGTSDGASGDFRKLAGDIQSKYDPAAAQKLLAEGLQELGMKELPKMKVLSDDNDIGKKSLEFILAQWQQNLGYEAEANPVPHKLRVENASKHDFEILLALWGADYNDPMTFLDMWVTGGEFNEGYYNNAEYDTKVKAAQTEADPQKRAQLMADAEKILMADPGVYPIYFRARPYVIRDNIQGLFLPSYGTEFELKWASVK